MRVAAGRGRREARLVDGGDADRGHRRAVGAPAAVRRPVRGAGRGSSGRAACRTTRARSRSCCAPRARASLEPVWHELRTLELPAAGDRGRPRRRLQRARRSGSRRRRRTARAAIVEDAGHAPQLQQPDEVAALIAEFLRLQAAPTSDRGAASLLVDVHAEARAGAAPRASRRAGGGSARASGRVEQLERRQPAGERQLLGGGQLQRGRDSPRAVERARQERVEPVRARLAQQLARRLEAAARRPASRSPTSQASSSDRAAQLAQRGDRLVRGDRRWTRAGAPRPARAAMRHGCSTSSRSCPSMRPDRVHRLVDRPGAVGVHPQRGPRPDRLAHRGHPLHVVGQPDLQLEAGVAVAQPGARALGHLLGRPGRRASCSPAARPCAARPAGAPPGARAGRAGRSPRRRAPAAAGARRRRVSAATARSSGTPSYGSNGAASP